MGRQIKRVALDFEWPLEQTWEGYLMPERLRQPQCPDCECGYSPEAEELMDLWYGKRPFDPFSTGSTPFDADTPPIRALAERNVASAADYYGARDPNGAAAAVENEADRLAALFNRSWSHHLSQEDVDALVDANRLYDFTHEFVPGEGWKPKVPMVLPTAAAVNLWSIQGMGHDGINAHVVVTARCETLEVPSVCSTCRGAGVVEAYPGHAAEAEAWEPTEPPEGEGWQLWETVSEGSPISPVCATAEELAEWMASPAYTWFGSGGSKESYLEFIKAGWAPSMVGSSAGIVSGTEWVAATSKDESPKALTSSEE